MAKEMYSIYEKLRKANMRKTNLNTLAGDLGSYNLADILSKTGALSLMPENGSHLVRLEALAAAVITNSYDPGKPKISRLGFKRVLNLHLGVNSSVTRLEDSCENLFTESITLFSGSYIIFPGLLPSASFLLRNFCKGLFLSGESIQGNEFKSSVYFEIMTLLLLSNEIARRANLRRGIHPSTITWEEEIRVPASKILGKLQSTVVFSRKQLEELFTKANIPSTCIEPYLSTPGAGKLRNNDFDSSAIYTKPIVKVNDRYIVPIPELLVHATIHRILSLAIGLKATSEFVECFRHATWDNVELSLNLLNTLPSSECVRFGSKDRTQWLESCYQFDVDKLLYIQYFTDDLKNYDVYRPFSKWVDKDIPKLIIRRQTEVLQHIYQESPGINNVLWLVLIQSYCRPFILQLHTSDLRCPTLALSVADLLVLSFSEYGDQLAIWNYLKHKIQTRRQRPVISASEIDEFEFYRSNGHSYSLPDDIHGIILIKAGTGGGLRRKVYSELDLHGVIGDQPHTVAEVMSSNNKGFPVSVISSLSHTTDRSAIVIEQFSIPVWVVGRRYTESFEDAKLHLFYVLLGDSIGFWLWRAKDYAATLINLLSSKIDRLTIEIDLQRSETWQQLPVDFKGPDANENVQEHISVETNRDEGKVKIKIKESIKTWLATPDNRIERGLMKVVFQGIRDLSRDIIDSTEFLQTDENIWEAVELYIPQGTRKKILALPIQDPRFDPKMLPSIRLIQEVDKVDAANMIRKYLRSRSFHDRVVTSPKLKTSILNSIVDYLYEELVKTISCLRTTDLLEFLLAQHEATVQRILVDRLVIPVQLDSFYNTQQLIEKLQKETPDSNQTSVALRFLIEYVSACPPHGLRPISYEVFDQLIALSAEITTLGVISDRINYGIDDASVEIRSGSLSIDQETYYTAFKTFIPNYFAELIGRSVEHFDKHWHRPKYSGLEQTQNELDNQFDRAFLAEFGFSVRDHQMICGQIVELGYEQDAPIKYLPQEQLITEIVKETNIPYDTVFYTIDSLSLKEREDYLKPPAGYEKWEVYPWKVNRNLSFLRKPLISVQRGEEKGILWGNRHLVHTVDFLYNHCYSGKLRASSQIMKRLVSNIRNEEGEAFNDEVFDAFVKQRGTSARRRIVYFCGTEMADAKGKLGDIDVLAVNDSKGSILTIECKNLNAAISPAEYQNELKNLYIDDEGKDSEATKLIRRARWVEENIEIVMREMNITSKMRWKIQPLIVTSEELFTPYLKKASVTTISFKRLLEEFIPIWIGY